MSKIGVFICHCGENIGATVDCAKVAEAAASMEGVAFATDYKYMCSDPGQTLIKKAIREHRLDGVVVGACSPRMHEPTFRKACAEAGLNPYLCEIANLREHCSWVHPKGDDTTEKAIEIVHGLVEKVRRNSPLTPIHVPITKKALVIGGGIAGIQAALDIANCGHKVILVEKEPSIGGHMSQLSETFPTLDCSQCILTPRMVEVAQHPNITLYTYAELDSLSGFIGNFEAKIRLKAKSIDESLCTGCGLCTTKCPQKKIPSEFNAGLGRRTAIYVPFPQAVPNKPVIDKGHCTHYRTGKCGVCEKVCPTHAIRFGQEDRIINEQVGAVVVTTGFNVLGTDFFPEYGYGRYADVITRPREYPTARRYAACIRPSTPCSTSTRCTGESLMCSTWTYGPAERTMRSLCAGPSRKTTSTTCAAALPAYTRKKASSLSRESTRCSGPLP